SSATVNIKVIDAHTSIAAFASLLLLSLLRTSPVPGLSLPTSATLLSLSCSTSSSKLTEGRFAYPLTLPFPFLAPNPLTPLPHSPISPLPAQFPLLLSPPFPAPTLAASFPFPKSL